MSRNAPSDRMDQCHDLLASAGRWSSRAAFDRYYAQLFRGISFAGRRVLDIGGGIGTCSFLAALGGASEVVCLEPENDGSTSGSGQEFRQIKRALKLSNVRIEPATFQEFVPPSAPFDVVLFHNSINHLDENACIRLRTSEDARFTYRHLFQKLGSLASENADLVIADCTSRNLFPMLGLGHPISRSIEWEKHQPPEVWAKELKDVGFHESGLSWTSYQRLGSLGWSLTANRWAAFVLTGHFVLHMKRMAA